MIKTYNIEKPFELEAKTKDEFILNSLKEAVKFVDLDFRAVHEVNFKSKFKSHIFYFNFEFDFNNGYQDSTIEIEIKEKLPANVKLHGLKEIYYTQIPIIDKFNEWLTYELENIQYQNKDLIRKYYEK